MDFNELEQLISKDETKNIELKKSTGELREGMHSACAFLNSDGGILVFGVSPSLKITGQIVSESTRRDIAQALVGIEPAVSLVIDIEKMEPAGWGQSKKCRSVSFFQKIFV